MFAVHKTQQSNLILLPLLSACKCKMQLESEPAQRFMTHTYNKTNSMQSYNPISITTYHQIQLICLTCLDSVCFCPMPTRCFGAMELASLKS